MNRSRLFMARPTITPDFPNPVGANVLRRCAVWRYGTPRDFLLLEAHGYASCETIETVFEMLSWFDKHVKNAPARTKEQTATAEGFDLFRKPSFRRY